MKAAGVLTYSADRLPPRRPGSQAAAAAILLSMAVVTAQAANIEVTGSSRDGVATITVEGTLLVGDGDKFEESTSALRDAIVVFHSDGGNPFEGIKIGETIRRKGFSSLVVAQCASACAVAWLGGTHRFMAAGAHIGFHAAYNAKSGQESGFANARIGAYLNRIGLTDDAVTYVTAAPPNSITWLSVADAKQYRIDVTLLNVSCGPECWGNSNAFYVTQALARLNDAMPVVAGLPSTIAALPAVIALQRSDPAAFARFSKLFTDYAANAPEDALPALARAVLRKSLKRQLANAPADALVEITQVYLAYMQALQMLSPESCVALSDDSKGTNLRVNLAQQLPVLFGREIAILERVANVDPRTTVAAPHRRSGAAIYQHGLCAAAQAAGA
jgi:hypothetical protein